MISPKKFLKWFIQVNFCIYFVISFLVYGPGFFATKKYHNTRIQFYRDLINNKEITWGEKTIKWDKYTPFEKATAKLGLEQEEKLVEHLWIMRFYRIFFWLLDFLLLIALFRGFNVSYRIFWIVGYLLLSFLGPLFYKTVFPVSTYPELQGVYFFAMLLTLYTFGSKILACLLIALGDIGDKNDKQKELTPVLQEGS